MWLAIQTSQQRLHLYITTKRLSQCMVFVNYGGFGYNMEVPLQVYIAMKIINSGSRIVARPAESPAFTNLVYCFSHVCIEKNTQVTVLFKG